MTSNYTNTFKEYMNNTCIDLVIDMLDNRTEFSLVVSSKNWDSPLPENLASIEYFIIQIKEQTMEESYYDRDTNEIYINTQFNNIPNSKTLYSEDIKGIMDITMQIPIMMKPYSQEPKYMNIEKVQSIHTNPLVNFTEEELSPEVKHSIDCFIKNNKNLFNTGV